MSELLSAKRKIPAAFIFLAFAVAFLSHGGYSNPFLIHFVIALSGMALIVFGQSKSPNIRWPFPKRITVCMGALFGLLSFQLILSPNRWSTLQGLLWILDCLIVFIVIHSLADSKKDLQIIAVFVLGTCIAQLLFLPTFGLRHSLPVGPFVNPNHAAAFLGFGIWFSWRAGRILLFGTDRRGANIRTLLTLVLVGGVLMTFSTGATAALALAAFLFFVRKRISPRISFPTVYGILLILQIIIAFQTENLHTQQLADLAPTQINDNARRGMVRSTIALFAENPIVGNGLGSFSERFPSLADIETTDRVANFSHQDLLQLLAELGLPIFAIALYLFVLAFRFLGQAIRKDEHLSSYRFRQAVFWTLITLGFHSLVDFPFRVPFVFLAMTALAAASISRFESETKQDQFVTSLGRKIEIGFASACFLITVFSLSVILAQRWTRAGDHLAFATRLMPGNPEPPIQAVKKNLEKADSAQALHFAEIAVSRAPFDADVRQLYALALNEGGEISRAAEQMTRAAELDPLNGKRLTASAAWLYRKEFYDLGAKVTAYFKNLAEPHWHRECFNLVSELGNDPLLLKECVHPNSKEELVQLAMYLSDKGLYQPAFEEAYATLPDTLKPNLVHWYSQLALQAKQLSKAILIVEDLKTQKEPPVRVEVFHLSGQLNLLAGFPGKALASLNKAAELDDSPTEVWKDVRKGLYEIPADQCHTFAEKWQKTFPDSSATHLATSICYEMEKQFGNALSEAQSASQKNPGNRDAWLAQIHLWNQKAIPHKAIETACDALHSLSDDAVLLRMCINGLAQTGQCKVLQNEWRENLQRWPSRDQWATLADELKTGAVLDCLGRNY